MRVVVLLVLAACASAQEVSNGPQDKPGYEQTEAPDKQVEYVTGPNVGIVGPTVLGGKGQEVQPSGEDLQSTDKEQRDVSAQGAVYSGYQELPGSQEESKGQADAAYAKADAAYAKYAASLNYSGMKLQTQEPQQQYRKAQKKPQVVKIGHRPTTQKVAYYQSEGPVRYTQSQEQYYEPQNQEQRSAQQQAHIHAHQLNRSPVRGSQEYQQAQTNGQEERRSMENQGKSEANSSHESHSQEEGNEGQQVTTTSETPLYIPQEYLQYQLTPQEGQVGDLQSALQFPGKHQLQLFLPQEASGRINGHEQPQVTTVQNPNVENIQNGHQIQYIPAYITSQQDTLQKESQPQHPSLQIIRQHHQPVKQQQPAVTLHNAYSSSPANPSVYHRAQYHPQLYSSQLHSSQLQFAQLHSSQLQSPQLHSNFQPSQHQPTLPYINDPAQFHLFQQSNEAHRRPQFVYVQAKQSAQPIQLAQKTLTAKPSNPYLQPQSHPIIYRPKSSARLPQRQPELPLTSESPPKTNQHRQTHDKPPSHQSQQVYQSESIQNTDDKLGAPLQTGPYIQNVQKIQNSLHIQSPTPFPVKVVSVRVQPHFQIPLTHYELTSDKVALRPLLYPMATPIGQPVQTETPHQTLELIPTEAAKSYNAKIPNYIKALEQQTGQSKPFGFTQMSYGQKPGSYSYSIFNKHS